MNTTKTLWLFSATLAILFFTSCDKGLTHYEIRYCFNNTDMHSDFLEAYELTPEGSNGKWRSTIHHLDTIVTDGDTTEWASGAISDISREGCIALKIFTSGFRPCGGGNYTLDTLYHLEIGERNFIYINPGLTWTPTYGAKSSAIAN